MIPIPPALISFAGSKLFKFGAPLLALALVSGWALIERSGRLSALNRVVGLEGALELRDERIREQNRSLQALGNATTAANARAQLLAAMRARENAPLVAMIGKLEGVVAAGAQQGKDCRDALREWRAGQ
jgi:hypothetical protein